MMHCAYNFRCSVDSATAVANCYAEMIMQTLPKSSKLVLARADLYQSYLSIPLFAGWKMKSDVYCICMLHATIRHEKRKELSAPIVSEFTKGVHISN